MPALYEERRIRLHSEGDWAAYRELEAFAQLGTELDKATQHQLDRGARMVELLKQPQYEPMDVVDQVIQIFARSNGYVDDISGWDFFADDNDAYDDPRFGPGNGEARDSVGITFLPPEVRAEFAAKEGAVHSAGMAWPRPTELCTTAGSPLPANFASVVVVAAAENTETRPSAGIVAAAEPAVLLTCSSGWVKGRSSFSQWISPLLCAQLRVAVSATPSSVAIAELLALSSLSSI